MDSLSHSLSFHNLSQLPQSLSLCTLLPDEKLCPYNLDLISLTLSLSLVYWVGSAFCFPFCFILPKAALLVWRQTGHCTVLEPLLPQSCAATPRLSPQTLGSAPLLLQAPSGHLSTSLCVLLLAVCLWMLDETESVSPRRSN